MNKAITWNVVNSLLAGALIFLGALSDGEISSESIILACIAAFTIAVTQFKKYWTSQEGEYCDKTLGSFII